MPPQTDRERLAHFVELIGAEPREAVFDEGDNLIELNLAGLNLTNLPGEIAAELAQLINLRLLDLYNNQLTSLPVELAQLTNLQLLDLDTNQLTSIPIEFAQLTNLQELYLRNNQFTSIPLELAQLTSLQRLHLQRNQLTSVPTEFAQLANLQQLSLHNNQLTSVPAEFAQLTNLRLFKLSNNQLRNLPIEFAQLTNLQELRLENNPWRTPPPEIASAELDDIMHYLCSLAAGAMVRYEAKLLLLGEGGSGKSSLLRALTDLPFDAHLPSTHGINIQPYHLPYPPQPATEMTLNVWDFGGQQIYHTTHQFFMTKRSLYLLVWNARGDTDQGRLDHWLRNIQVLAPDVPVLLVATHIDERPGDFNFARFKAAYPQLVGSIGVSNKTGVGLEELRQLIATEAAKLDLMEQQWPQTWVQVETALQQDERYHINSHEYAAICAQNGVTRLGEQATLGSYLHDLGKILYFQDDDALSDFVVLKPNWLTQTMARVLDDTVTRDQNLGVLEHQDFRRLWPENEANMHYERRLYPLFHRLLERFLLCYRLEEETPGHAQSLVPLLLPHTPPANLPIWATMLPDQPEIRMLFKLDFVPPGIMSWFIVLSHHYSQNLQWREGVRLQYEGHEADVVLNASTRELWLQVRGPAPSNFFSLLNHMINDRIIRRYFEGLQYKRQIPCICPQCKKKPDIERHFFDYDRLAAQKQRGKRLAVVCELSDEEVSILELLEGIHHSTYDRIEEKLDAIHGLVSSDHELLVQNLQLSEQLTREATRTWNLLTSNLSSEAPSTFLLMPGERSTFNPRNLFDTDFTLYLLCQHPAGPHLVKGEKGYPLPHGRDWWSKVAPWLRELVKYLKYVPKASGIAETYDQTYYKTIELNVEVFKTAIDIIPEFTDDLARHEMERMVDLGRPMEVQGAALRALHIFLKEADPTAHWCGLRKVATNDGNVLWLCAEHAKFHGI
ncbi:MAG: COR domain-containing protein [Caldilineaceae bacterium]